MSGNEETELTTVVLRWNWLDCDTPKDESDDVQLKGTDKATSNSETQPSTPITCYEDTHHTPGTGEANLWRKEMAVNDTAVVLIELIKVTNIDLGQHEVTVELTETGPEFTSVKSGSTLLKLSGTTRLLEFSGSTWRYVGQFEVFED